MPDSTGTTVGAQQLHSIDVQPLAANVLRPHVHDALESEARADGGGGDAMLTGPGLGDDPALSHPAGEQCLTQCVVDLVGTGVVQVFPLEHYPRANGLAEAGRLGKRRRAAHKLGQQVLQLGPESRVLPCRLVESCQVVEGRDQGLGHIPSTVGTKPAGQTLLR